MDDPKKRQKPIEDDVDGEDLRLQVASLQKTVEALLKQKSEGLSEDRLEQILTRVAHISAEAQERAANPSNKTHPGISVFSYPEGDRARPRPALKCEMYWLGHPATDDVTTAEEMELMNLAEPGEYSFKRTDGPHYEKLEVRARTDAAGKPTRLEFIIKDYTNRHSWPDNPSILRQAFKVKSAQELELEQLRIEVEALRSVHA